MENEGVAGRSKRFRSYGDLEVYVWGRNDDGQLGVGDNE